ncbi:protein dead ringer-like isoform X2 [Homalodisca vitripennis]|uniref:protein dead ringer-like isoform X2 n=1 Tax=Homalodisca vitripennis TaxID=197043 RepID=UPI001EEA038F|nr:protein dead ringer-like isoform X2 [Homalodisca vitripennis]
MDHRDSDMEGGVCSPDFISRRIYEAPLRPTTELSEHEEDSDSASSRRTHETTPEQDVIAKIKRERDAHEEAQRDTKPPLPISSAASPMVPPPAFSLPMPFPFPHPGAAFLPPAPAYPPAPHPATAATHHASSGSSHSSESSTSSQTQQWPFEEQFKQYTNKAPESSPLANIGTPEEQFKQLYEISDDPKRKDFLDDLFSFMQRRGTPINRLPIMAKSVLDLFELYNLVIQRGGLVDVINKKLWQEIIKGLHLPSSITSAAFTLRTQYMKYLYPYECEKRRLSTPGELQAAIDGNRREGRRGSYGTYAEMMQRSPSQMSPLSLVTAARPQVNGSAAHHPTNNNHLPHQALIPPALAGHGAAIPPAEFEARMVEYVKLLNKELRTSGATPPNHRQSSLPTSLAEKGLEALNMSRNTLWNLYRNQTCVVTGSPPTSPPETALAAFDMSRLTLWNLYHNQTSPTEPQKEPINLEKREDPVGPPPLKRHQPDSEEPKVTGTHIKISSRNDGRGGGDNSLVVSMDINGTMYQGVLFAQTTRNSRLPS